MAAPGTRMAERPRKATCSLADTVAAAGIEAYHKGLAAAGLEHSANTVLAAFVVCDGEGAPPVVVAWGAGTKFITMGEIEDDVGGERVRDGHAEVLARRALLLYFHRQLCAAVSASPGGSIFEVGPAMAASAEGDGVAAFPADLPSFRLRPGVVLHFYTSSQPCGNATVKRWAKGAPEPAVEAGELELPTLPPHTPVHFCAVAEGQVAVLVKSDGVDAEPHALPPANALVPGVPPRPVLEVPTHPPKRARYPVASAVKCPPGTALATSGKGFIMSCSDKIARWNALGLQGGLLSRLLPAPLTLASITVGRKFTRLHTERALCCRLADFCPDRRRSLAAIPGQPYGVHHPTLLQTSVKLDVGMVDDSGAVFTPNCLVWSFGDAAPEVLDGGKAAGGTVSLFSRAAMLASWRGVMAAVGGEPAAKAASGMTYGAAKATSPTYVAARAILVQDPSMFGAWVQDDPRLQAFK